MMQVKLFLTSILLATAGLVTGQNLFPAYSIGSYSGGSVSDFTDISNAQLKLQSTSGYIRVPHISASASVSTVFNFETGKSVYWGEDTDVGNYIFRGRKVAIGVSVPTHALSVFGSSQNVLLVKSSSHAVLDIESGQGVNSYLRFANNGVMRWDIASETTGDLRIYDYVDQLVRFRITSDGNAEVTGGCKVLGNSNPINFTSAWSATPDNTTNVSEISNDVSTFKALMIVGNKSAGQSERRVGIWDRLSINGAAFLQNFNVNGGGYFSGNVGIGTTDPGSFKLAVNGKIWSQEVNVAMTNPGPDYVFEPDYDLLSLSELETYINQNKHLPEVPSAKEMEKEGLNLKEMNLLLLRKIEELTLHLIEQNKTIADLKEKTSSPDPSGKKVEELTLHLIEMKKEVVQLQEDNLSLKNLMEQKNK